MQKIEDAIKASSAHAKRILTAQAKFVKKIPRDSRGDEAIVQRPEVYEEIKTSIVPYFTGPLLLDRFRT